MRDKFYPPVHLLRTIWPILLIAFLSLSSCSLFDPKEQPLQLASSPTTGTATEPISTSTTTPPPATAAIVNTPTPNVIPTETQVIPTDILLPTQTDIPSETETPIPVIDVEDDLYIEAGQLNLYPPGPLFAGDKVTFQLAVSIPDSIPYNQVLVRVEIDGEQIALQSLNGGNLGRETLLTLPQIWDTSGQEGSHTVVFTADPNDQIQVGDENPNNNSATYEITIRPPTVQSVKSSQATWITRETDYARIHVVSGTAAARDLDKLVSITDASLLRAIAALTEKPRRVYDVYFVDRVIGQGGYAGGSMVISYTDRNYSGGRIEEVIVHETIHLLDQQISPNGRLTFLAEGLAVWGSGGHYKPEELNPRAAALVATGYYIPLNQIIDNFYPVQHEIGYLEAGAFVQYLVDTYGWAQFKQLYSRLQPADDGTNAVRLDQILQAEYGKSLEQIEQEWLAKLGEITLDRNVVADLNGTIRFYNIMRHYQEIHDPTAYFLEAWLPSPNGLREQGFTAELSRHPEEPINLVLEVMLTEAEILLRSGNFRQAEVLMGSVERALNNQDNFIDPLGASYNDIALAAYNRGFEVQRIVLDGQTAVAVYTINNGSQLKTLEFTRQQTSWVVVQ
ncbi:MAG: hypothetical protein ACI9EW_001645 [Cellvibrionaceae bacterium]|jgi:hypothetical protein